MAGGADVWGGDEGEGGVSEEVLDGLGAAVGEDDFGAGVVEGDVAC